MEEEKKDILEDIEEEPLEEILEEEMAEENMEKEKIEKVPGEIQEGFFQKLLKWLKK